MSLFSIGFSLIAALENAVNLEVHGEYKIALLLGLQLFSFGIGTVTMVPLAGKLFYTKFLY